MAYWLQEIKPPSLSVVLIAVFIIEIGQNKDSLFKKDRID